MRALLLATVMLAPLVAQAEVQPLQPGSDGSSLNVTATGGTTARTNAARASDVLNVRDFGAKCDGTPDDTVAINAAVAAFRASLTTNNPRRLVFPGGVCRVTSPLNFTGLATIGAAIDGNDTTIYGAVAGGPVIDAMGSKWFSLTGLHIVGDATNTPTTGIQIGRINTTALDGGGSGIHLTDVSTDGQFSLAGFYNFSGEVCQFDHIWFQNTSTSSTAYAAIQDAINHFGVTSSFVTQKAPANVQQSFNENVFINSSFETYNGATPLWIAGGSRHRYQTAYIANTQSGGHAITLYGITGSSSVMLDMDIHSESTALQDVILVSGTNPTPTFPGLRYQDHSPFASRSIFKLDTGVTSASIQGGSIDIAAMVSGAVVFNEASSWTFSGVSYAPSGGYWNLPAANAQGLINVGGVVAGSAQSFGSGLALNGGVLSVSLPSPLNISAIATQGGVASTTISSPGNQTGVITSGTGFPTLSLPAPPTGGTQATIAVATMGSNGPGYVANGGINYVVGDHLVFVGGTYTTPAQATVTSISTGGVITGLSGYAGGSYTALPLGNITLSGGSGTGGSAQGANWFISSVSIIAAGGAYSGTLTATATASPGTTINSAPSISALIGNAFTATGGAGKLLMDSNGTTIGVSGTAGTAVIHAGAVENAALATSTPATGATITAAANTDSYFVDGTVGATLAALTFKLPVLTGRVGQRFEMTVVPTITTATVQTSANAAVANFGGAAGLAPGTHAWKVVAPGGPWRPIL